MAETLTTRVGLRQYSAGGDGFSRADYNADNLALENKVALDEQGIRSARPAPAIRGRFYTVVGDGNAALNGTIYRDNGTAWEVVGARIEDANFRSSATNTVAVTVTGLAGQTADLLQWRSSIGTLLGNVTAAGALNVAPGGNSFGGAAVANTALTARSVVASGIAFVARGFTSQSVDIQQWQDAGGAVLSRVDQTGKAWFKGLQSAVGLTVVGNTDMTGNLLVTGTADFKSLQAVASATSSVALIAKGMAAQTADIFQVLDNSNTELMAVQADGLTVLTRLGIGDTGSGTRLRIASAGANDIPLRLKGFLGQIGNLIEWRDNSDTLLGRIDAAGRLQSPAVHFSGFIAPNASDLATQYPDGVTFAAITSQTGYPQATGHLKTIKNDPTMVYQTFYSATTTRQWERMYTGGAWTIWRELTVGQCAAKMLASGTVSIPDGTTVPFPLDTVSYQTHSGMCNTTTDSITIPAGEGGRYKINGQIIHSGATGGTLSYRSCGIQVNAVGKNRFGMRPDPGADVIWTPTPVEWTGYLNAGDVVRLETYQFTGGTTQAINPAGIAEGNYLQVEKVGPPL